MLWAAYGGKNYEFVGLAPLSPETCGSYTGTVYSWGNITPAVGYDPIKGQHCVPPDGGCIRDENNPSITVDNTPIIPQQFTIDSFGGISEISRISDNQDLEEPSNLICETNPVITNRPPRRRKQVSKGERLCCQTMERIYGVPFENVRPSWLLNHTGYPLELDCYNADLQLAVEYNGEQHYKWPNFTNQSYDEFVDQIERDNLKREICDRHGVYLIPVPYNVSHNNIPAYITSYLPETIQKRLSEDRTLVS